MRERRRGDRIEQSFSIPFFPSCESKPIVPITNFLFPPSAELQLEEITNVGQILSLTVRSSRETAACPDCAYMAGKVHSRYVRTVADVPLMDYAVRLHVLVRRFFCSNPACHRKTFAESFADFVAAYARRTTRQSDRLCAIAKELGGRPGARESRNARVAVSRQTLLRCLLHASISTPSPVRVLGVDDWAFRKGRTYGTILVDLERHCIIDLLEDRLAETFAAWLRNHPSIEIISRDRASAYAEGGRAGAPEAIQVVDRWHLLRNVADALDSVLRRQEQLWKPSKASAGIQEPKKQEPKPLEPRLTPAKRQRREERQGQYVQVQSLYEQGQSLHEIAKNLGIDTNALRYFVHNQPWATAQGRGGRRPGAASLDAYLPYIHKRWKAGCQNGMQLWREIRAQGYAGSASSVRPYLALLRQAPPALLPMKVSAKKSSTSKPEENAFPVRRLIWLVLCPPEQLTPEQTQEVTRASALHPTMAFAFKLAQTFAKLLRERTVEALPAWLASARTSAIPEFVQLAHGMRRDLTAVEAALSRPESNGQTEGKVNKLKTIKRQMYGRATFALLRQRMLLCG